MSSMQWEQKARQLPAFKALVILNVVAIGFFFVGAIRNQSWQYWFLLWNLFLAWLPLVFAYGLELFLGKKPWLSWGGVILSALWLGFLPNSFYMISDFIHLATDSGGRVDLVFDVIMFTSFAFTGLALGFSSLYLVHKQLVKRLQPSQAYLVVAAVLLLCGFAIYLGRNLRLNTWDILVNPFGILFSVSDPFFNIRGHPQFLSTTLGFFVLLGSMYLAFWLFIQSLRPSKHR